MKYKAIIVEDDPMVASINESYLLRNQNFEVVRIFNNGKEALSFCEENKIDLAIVDYYMPLMNGFEFVDNLRKDKNDLKVIMITAANKKEEIVSLLRLGVIDYLIKPFTYERFKIAIDKFLDIESLLEDKKNLNQKDIDELLSLDNKKQDSSILEKGLQNQTMNLIIETINENDDLTSEEIAKKVNLSRITVRRYMNYLVDNKIVKSTIDYSTGGRPSIKYQKI